MENFAVFRANYAKIVESIQARRIQVKLSIADQRPKERIAENRRKWSIIGMLFLRALCILPALFILLPIPAFYAVPCLHLFLVFSHFILVIAFRFWFFFGNFIYTEHLYKLQSIKTLYQSLHVGNIERGDSFADASSFSIFFHFLFPFLGYQTLL